MAETLFVMLSKLLTAKVSLPFSLSTSSFKSDDITSMLSIDDAKLLTPLLRSSLISEFKMLLMLTTKSLSDVSVVSNLFLRAI